MSDKSALKERERVLLSNDSDIDYFEIPEGHVLVLWSVYGLEGVFTSIEAAKATIADLRKFAAYLTEKLNIEGTQLNRRYYVDRGE